MLNICIQNLGMYNEGILLFKWLTLPATEEEIDKALSEIRICHTDVDGNEVRFTDEFGCPYEEMHIPDWECDIAGIDYNEWASIDYYNEIAEQLDDLSEYDKHWLNAYIEATNECFDNALEDYQDNSRYWDGMTTSEVAVEIADKQMECMIPMSTGYGCDRSTKAALEWLQTYFDYDAYERDLNLFETNDGVIETW